MRRSITLLIVALSSASLLGCEDGPNQTYSPAPPGAGDLMNNGGTGPAVDPVRSGLGDSYPGKSRAEICSADEKRTRWAKAVSAPIEPPRKYGNIDMAGDDTWRGITAEQADQVNCQSIADGDGQLHWGDNSEIQFFYDIGTHVVTQMQLNLGYSGKMKVFGRKADSKQTCYNYLKDPVVQDDSCPHKDDVYEMGIGTMPLKNGKPWLFDPADPHWISQVSELYDATVATYMPDQAPVINAKKSGAALVLPDDGLGNVIFGFRPAAVYFMFHAHTPQPTLSTPYQLYNFFIKILPYSNAPMEVKLNAEGPVAHQLLGDSKNPKNCQIKLGQSWKDMMETCVKITGDPALDTQNFNKLVGGRIHTLDDIFFNVVGVNQNVTLELDTYQYVKDDQLPKDTDKTTEFIFDVRARGALDNEINPDPTVGMDLHGSGLVVREYLRLAQQEIYRLAGTPAGQQRKIGDPKCRAASTDKSGCTGLENVLMPGPALGDKNPSPPALDGGKDADDLQTNADQYVSFLKPGDHLLWTCKDPVKAVGGDLIGGGCDGDAVGGTPLAAWDGPFQNVVNTFGRGDLYNLPPAVRDRRFFFQQFTIALAKYMKAYGASCAGCKGGIKGHTTTLSDVANVKLDMENVFWDISDILSFDKIEYIDRDFVDANNEPTNFEYGSDVKVANQRETKWDRKMSRAERAMYQALMGNSALPLGKKDNVRISNLFGSDVLSGSWASGSQAWESMNCATVGTDNSSCSDKDKAAGKTCCSSAKPPWDGAGDFHVSGNRDSDGLPLLADYSGAWGGTIFHKGNSPARLIGMLNNVQVAKIAMPQFSDEYDQTSPLIQNVYALVPHKPMVPGVGVSIPLSGTRDKLVPAGELDFTGNTSTYRIKYQYQTCTLENLDLAKTSKACNTATQQNFICAAGAQPAQVQGDAITADGSCQKSDVKRADGQDNYCCDGLMRQQFVTMGTTGTDNAFGALLKVIAIDSEDFLGDIFVCADPRTGDILRTRMYDSAQSLLDWFTDHPGTIQACDIVIRYSAFNNYIDKIFSRTYGVSLDISKSFGAGRIADAMLWDSGLLAQ